LHTVAIPAYDPTSSLHKRLAELSQKAHKAKSKTGTKSGKREKASTEIVALESAIDEAAAELWNITPAEMNEIRRALKDLD